MKSACSLNNFLKKEKYPINGPDMKLLRKTKM